MSTQFRVGQTWRTGGGEQVQICGVRASEGLVDVDPTGDVADEYVCDINGVCISNRRWSDGGGICDLVEQVERVYIAGPIGSTPMEQARIPFDAAAELYRSRGCIVMNPCDLVPPGTPYGECMRIDLTALLTCDTLVVLPGYTMSRGAMAEIRVAELCGLAIVWPEQ